MGYKSTDPKQKIYTLLGYNMQGTLRKKETLFLLNELTKQNMPVKTTQNERDYHRL